MNFHYDKDTDSLYIMLAPGGSVESEEVSHNVILDYDAEGRVVGIDLQHASTQSDLGNFFVSGLNPVLRHAG